MKVYAAIAHPDYPDFSFREYPAQCEKLFFKKEDANQYMETQNTRGGWNRVVAIEEMIVE